MFDQNLYFTELLDDMGIEISTENKKENPSISKKRKSRSKRNNKTLEYYKYMNDANIDCFNDFKDMGKATCKKKQSFETSEYYYEEFLEKYYYMILGNDYLSDYQQRRPYKCGILGCNKYYSSEDFLRYHRDNDHEIDQLKPYYCAEPNCNKRYKNQNGLDYHLKHNHIDNLKDDDLDLYD
ncbi:Zinc finger C2H2 protein [Astathelohania contejeani]|uniref:Zinc finger C2H2 protein n=1 Tax=Astathelohania contejeani TaxID=164912 RepID=A0ABQ7I0R9_9MICR|nr:Zinc finger C2H2 protein [Thelohania contejeani]